MGTTQQKRFIFFSHLFQLEMARFGSKISHKTENHL